MGRVSWLRVILLELTTGGSSWGWPKLCGKSNGFAGGSLMWGMCDYPKLGENANAGWRDTRGKISESALSFGSGAELGGKKAEISGAR